MSNNLLQDYLNLQIINPDDDGNFDKLGKAVDEVKKKLMANRSLIVPYTLAALDPSISSEDASIKDVYQIIAPKWPTFVASIAKTKDTPVTYVRAIMLDALSKLAEDDINARLIWYSSRNVIRYYSLNREEQLLTGLIKNIGQKVEDQASNEWRLHRLSSVGSVPELNLKKIIEKVPNIQKEELKTMLVKAAQHSGWPGGGENPEAPTQQNWALHFSDKAADGLLNALKSIYKTWTGSLENLQNEIEANMSAVNKNGRAIYLRNTLLWLKESGYSETAKRPFDSIQNKSLAATVLAMDFARNLSHVFPASVDSFHRKYLLELVEGADSKNTIQKLLSEIYTSRSEFKELFPVNGKHVDSARMSLFQFVHALVNDTKKVEDLTSATGLSLEGTVSLVEYSNWMHHDIQVQQQLEQVINK